MQNRIIAAAREIWKSLNQNTVGPGTVVVFIIMVSLISYGSMRRYYTMEASGVGLDIRCSECGAGRNMINLYDPNGFLETAECQRCKHRWKL
jgi:hypothetical protein